MADPTVDIFRDLLEPLGERLQQDARFAEFKNIVYDIDDLAFSELPGIVYYAEGPWQDESRGTAASGLQYRRMIARVVFGIWIFDNNSRQALDRALFHYGGHLIDWLRENTEFGNNVGLSRSPIVWQVDRAQTDQGFVGVHIISAEFDSYAGVGR
jgi:hypothetical protein